MVCCLLWAQLPFLSGFLLCHRIYMIEMDFTEVKRIIYKADGEHKINTDMTFWLELDAVFNHCHVRSYHQVDCHAHAVTHIQSLTASSVFLITKQKLRPAVYANTELWNFKPNLKWWTTALMIRPSCSQGSPLSLTVGGVTLKSLVHHRATLKTNIIHTLTHTYRQARDLNSPLTMVLGWKRNML